MWVLKSDCVKQKETSPTPLDLCVYYTNGCYFSRLFVVCIRRVCLVVFGYQESSQKEKKMN